MRTHPTERSRRALERIVDHREGPSERADQALLGDLIKQSLLQLDIEYQMVISLRYGLGGYSYSLEQTGRILRLSRERVRAVELAALRRLGYRLSSHGRGPLREKPRSAPFVW
jgi:RNA polymerase primary sigma factor